MLIKKFQNGFSKLKALLPIYGFLGTIIQITQNIIMVDVYYRFEKDLRVTEEKYIPKIPLEIVPLSGDIDLDKWGIRDALLQIRGPYGVEQAIERLASGYVMFCAYSEGKLAGFIWLNSFPVIGAGYTLQDYEAYHIDGWTFEPYRGKGVLPTLQQGVFQYLRANYPQIQILIGHAAARNKPSVTGQQRAGLILVAQELSLVFLGYHRKIRLSTIKKDAR